jgi:endonuclease YncB( thermonuclease family)
MRAWRWYQNSNGVVWCKQHAHIGAARDQAWGRPATIPVAIVRPGLAIVRSARTAVNRRPVVARPRANRRRPWTSVVLSLVALCCGGGVFTTLLNDDTNGSRRETTQATPPALVAAPGSANNDGTGGGRGAAANRPETVTVVVTNVIDGDTVDVSTGHRIRLIGIDTPERGECGYDQATANLASLVRGKEVTLVGGARDDTDQYGHLLRYIHVDNIDAGLEQIKAGYAIARYDSRDGYGAHPREQSYIAADNATPNYACPNPPRQTQRGQAPPPAQSNCHPSYTPCVPNVPYDLDCPDIGFPVTVIGPDVYRLDNNDPDNIGCESYG